VVLALGTKVFIATNAAGGAQTGMVPGSIMIINDHVNGLKRSAIAGLCRNCLLLVVTHSLTQSINLLLMQI
jgi:purine nucleoside phosphorylase